MCSVHLQHVQQCKCFFFALFHLLCRQRGKIEHSQRDGRDKPIGRGNPGNCNNGLTGRADSSQTLPMGAVCIRERFRVEYREKTGSDEELDENCIHPVNNG